MFFQRVLGKAARFITGFLSRFRKCSSSCLARAPQATRAAVSRADARSSIFAGRGTGTFARRQIVHDRAGGGYEPRVLRLILQRRG